MKEFIQIYGSLIGTFFSSIVAILAIIANIYNTKNSLKANVVSSARIKWIQEVREKSIDFITACYDVIEYIKLNEPDENRILSLKNRLKKSGTLLVLYFGPDTSKNKNNDFIVYLIHLLIIKLVDQAKYYEDKNLVGMSEEVRVLEDFLRIYLKAEWKRANGDIKDDEVEEYIEKDELYRKIKKIYKDGFECEKECIDCFYNDLDRKYNE